MGIINRCSEFNIHMFPYDTVVCVDTKRIPPCCQHLFEREPGLPHLPEVTNVTVKWVMLLFVCTWERTFQCYCRLSNWCLCDSYLSCSIYCFLADFDRRYFWAWTDFVSYVDFMLLFTVICSILMYLFIDFMPFVELVGFFAVFTEALLGVPQALCNYHNKSTEGMRWESFMWLFWTVTWICGNKMPTRCNRGFYYRS